MLSLRSVQQSAALLRDMRKLSIQLAALRRLSACTERATALQVPNSETTSSVKIPPSPRNYKRKASYLRTAVGLGGGLLIGAAIKTCYDARSEDWQTPKILPGVHAANPFNISSLIADENNNLANLSSSGSNRKNFNFIADVVDKVSDGVVYIEIKDNRRRFKNAKGLSNGSGFIVSNDGLILTNAHVVTNRPRSSAVNVRLQNGAEYEGIVEEIDAISDLALIRIKCDNLKPIALGTSSDLRPGEFVAAIGSPLSLSNTITIGVVSSVGRASKELGLRGRDIQYIQTDAAITFGNSGGPLVNLDGEVIGINSMTVTSGISFAIPIDYAREFMMKAAKKRLELAKYPESSPSVRRRYIGVTMLTLTESIIQELQARGSAPHNIPADTNHGIFIWRIVVGSPAYQAGLQPGDVITHINNHPVYSSRDVYKVLESHGDLNMVVVRNGQRYSVTVVPEE
ncbi:serine protease HTRA2, mitochondrial isoform X1 [Palaemon carinicauda]|uniref:serine protease HTRA2, mitochondrial isoform X1 n=1 Tax=Palaemon carinicauda TaxID=392227 RepID=UPI0035B67DFC